MTVALTMGVIACAKDEDTIKSYGNEFKIDTYEDFDTGKEGLNNVIRNENGSVTLNEVNDEGGYGEYISREIEVPNFEYMVMSWNSDTPEGTSVEVQAKVLVNHYDKDKSGKDIEVKTWTDWLSWGEWSPFIQRASVSPDDELAYISVDELTIKGSSGETASRVQLKVIFRSSNSNKPTVRMLHGTLKNTLKGQAIEKQFESALNESDWNKNIATPAMSQMIRDPNIANSICSPTTITMIMNGSGERLLPEEVAQSTFDFNYGFGNWAFAMASAGSYGYEAYVDYTTIEGLKHEIAKGYPVGVSVKYSNDSKNTSYPYVEGAPGVTGGHLIVVTGFEKDAEGKEYVLVNDSYAPDNETVSRKYKLKQFERAWSNNTAYIIHEKEEGAGYASTKRIDAELVADESSEAFKIMVDDEVFDINNFDGTAAYTFNDDQDNFNNTEYNYINNFTNMDALKFPKNELSSPLKLYLITDYGYVYVINR